MRTPMTHDDSAASTTLTIRLTPEIKARLGQLADSTRRSKSFLAAEAIARYVEREAGIIHGIHQGLTDMQAGRLVPHATAMTELEAIIDAAESKKN